MCDMYPAELVIEDVLFKDFKGTTSTKYDPRIGELTCSSPDVCHDISVQDIDVTPLSGNPPIFNCNNMGDSDLAEIKCA